MKRLSTLLAGLILALSFEATQTFAQQNEKSNEFIVIELKIKKEHFFQKFKIQIADYKTPDDKYELHYKNKIYYAEPTLLGMATVDCFNCQLTSEYDFFGIANFMSEDKTNVELSIDFKKKKKCNVVKSV